MFAPTLCLHNLTVFDARGPLGHTVRIKGSRLISIGDPPQPKDRQIDGRGGLLIPGLINAHDHLELNTFNRLKYRECYSHSLQWIEDIEARFDTDPDLIEPRRQLLPDRLLIGALKNLLSGVTTVSHHNPLYRSLRYNYPIRVARNYTFYHSLFRGEGDLHTSYKKTRTDWPWIIHLAEGVDDRAASEFDQLAQMGAVGPNTVLVHGVGLTPFQRQQLIAQGGGLIWCPGSNHFMFGKTAQVAALAQAGKLALGSDSRLSGEFDLLAELRVANKADQLSSKALFRTITIDAARMLHLSTPGIGQIEVGGVADLVLLPPPDTADPLASLFNLDRSRVQLVMLGGKPWVGSSEMQSVFEATHTKFRPVKVDGVEKVMAQKLVRRLEKSAVAEPGLTFYA